MLILIVITMLTYFQFYSGICQQLDNFKPLQSQGKFHKTYSIVTNQCQNYYNFLLSSYHISCKYYSRKDAMPAKF